MYFGPVAGFADGLASAQNGVTINGESALAFFTVEEILHELGG